MTLRQTKPLIFSVSRTMSQRRMPPKTPPPPPVEEEEAGQDLFHAIHFAALVFIRDPNNIGWANRVKLGDFGARPKGC
jgi:hypothetical protein